MDDSDPLEARTARLKALRKTNPIAWAICQGKQGVTTIAAYLDLPQAQVQTELDRLLKAKEVSRKKYYRGYTYQPRSLELKRLARRAWAIKRERQRSTPR